jgi:hypothetical protein
MYRNRDATMGHKSACGARRIRYQCQGWYYGNTPADGGEMGAFYRVYMDRIIRSDRVNDHVVDRQNSA